MMNDLVFVEQNEDLSTTRARVVRLDDVFRMVSQFPWADRAARAAQTTTTFPEISPANVFFSNGSHSVAISTDEHGYFGVSGRTFSGEFESVDLTMSEIEHAIKDLAHEAHDEGQRP